MCVCARVQACARACTIVCMCVYMWAEMRHEQAQKSPGAQALDPREGASELPAMRTPGHPGVLTRRLAGPPPRDGWTVFMGPGLRPGEHPPPVGDGVEGTYLGVSPGSESRQSLEGCGLLRLLR